MSICSDPLPPLVFSSLNKNPKRPGEARFVFCSRVSPKKNIHFIIPLLGRLSGKVNFNIYGPICEKTYWEQCLLLIKKLPSNIKVTYHEDLPHEQVVTHLNKNDFFLLATRGENFGHAIVEGWAAGCPVIISDQTPWQDLDEKKIGWELPLKDKNRWVQILQNCVDMEENTYTRLSHNAIQFVKNLVKNPPIKETIQMFTQAGIVISTPPIDKSR